MRLLKNAILLKLIIVLAFSCQTAKVVPYSEAEKELSSQLGNAVLWFQKSAEMEAAYLQSYHFGKMLLTKRLNDFEKGAKRPAVVLDLDETVLDNSPYEARLFLNGQTYDPATWNDWCQEAKATALPGALDFLKFAEQKGVEIFYISNRTNQVFESTLKNLQAIGAPQAIPDHLLLRTAGSDKTERRNIVKENHEVLLYVGDNLTDYSEIYADRQELGKELVQKNKEELLNNFLMLPNPMYGEWESAIYDNDFSKSDEEKLRNRREALDTAKE